jgi:hypothetical protein
MPFYSLPFLVNEDWEEGTCSMLMRSREGRKTGTHEITAVGGPNAVRRKGWLEDAITLGFHDSLTMQGDPKGPEGG